MAETTEIVLTKETECGFYYIVKAEGWYKQFQQKRINLGGFGSARVVEHPHTAIRLPMGSIIRQVPYDELSPQQQEAVREYQKSLKHSKKD